MSKRWWWCRLLCGILVVYLVKTVLKMHREDGWCKKLVELRNPTFTEPDKVFVTEHFIPLGVVLIQHSNITDMEVRFKTGVTRMMESLFRHTESPLHFVVVTDHQSLGAVGQFLAQIVTKRLGTGAILSR